MIVEVALGVLLAFGVIVAWRGLLAIGIVIGIVAIALAVLVGGGVAAYFGFKALAAYQLPEAVSNVLWAFFALVIQLVFFGAFGNVVANNSSLPDREAYCFGAAIYVLILASVAGGPAALTRFAESGDLWIFLLGGLWIALVLGLPLRNRHHKMRRVSVVPIRADQLNPPVR